jgi:hypothetical protein
MIDLPAELRFALRCNDVSRRACEAKGLAFDPPPVIKLFNPVGAATWLATELAEDDDTLFGLADLGFGCPELGYFSLSEIGSVRLPYGLFIERDIAFESQHPLSIWAKWSRRAGSVLWAQTLLRRATDTNDLPELPHRPDEPNGG